ncbi:hypothetical protein BS78_K193100 [Paspalum vaginatum]|uniref:AP2/ERF domain-containing protein n=1 Tax=Paspalum vaginatum TaxID=158149 RepID=A0A9W7XBE9_9POAL|nr:hypothetical protein BS78_K193100 [Paspalum vaginatum]
MDSSFSTGTRGSSDGMPMRQYHGVRQMPTGMWEALILGTDGMMWQGNFTTAEAAARAYDKAATKHQGIHADLNFPQPQSATAPRSGEVVISGQLDGDAGPPHRHWQGGDAMTPGLGPHFPKFRHWQQGPGLPR